MMVDIDYFENWQQCTRGTDKTNCDNELLLNFIRDGELYVVDLLTQMYGNVCACGVRFVSDECGGSFSTENTIIKNAVCEYAYQMWKIDNLGEEENAEIRDLYKRNSFLLLKNMGYLQQ